MWNGEYTPLDNSDFLMSKFSFSYNSPGSMDTNLHAGNLTLPIVSYVYNGA
jgi:hypothetical protein